MPLRFLADVWRAGVRGVLPGCVVGVGRFTVAGWGVAGWRCGGLGVTPTPGGPGVHPRCDGTGKSTTVGPALPPGAPGGPGGLIVVLLIVWNVAPGAVPLVSVPALAALGVALPPDMRRCQMSTPRPSARTTPPAIRTSRTDGFLTACFVSPTGPPLASSSLAIVRCLPRLCAERLSQERIVQVAPARLTADAIDTRLAEDEMALVVYPLDVPGPYLPRIRRPDWPAARGTLSH